ncbi:MAG: ABC transporter ATP-binding protein [Verrucomicrobiota bacterium]
MKKQILQVEGLVKRLGGKPVVNEVGFACAEGEVVGLLGPNGAGKTTTLRMCYGFLEPDAGSVRIGDWDIQKDNEPASRALGVCTQDETYDGDFTVRGNLVQGCRYYRPIIENRDERVDEVMETFGLTKYADAKPETLSGGYRRRLMIARAVVHRPQVVFLDEPTTGLDPEARLLVWELVDTLRAQGMAVVLTTHYMDEAERLSDRLILLKDGKIRATGTTESLLGDVVGDHMVVVSRTGPNLDGVEIWLEEKGGKHSVILTDWHVPMGSAELAEFVGRFPNLRYEVRPPTLDDLFLTLAKEVSP